MKRTKRENREEEVALVQRTEGHPRPIDCYSRSLKHTCSHSPRLAQIHRPWCWYKPIYTIYYTAPQLFAFGLLLFFCFIQWTRTWIRYRTNHIYMGIHTQTRTTYTHTRTHIIHAHDSEYIVHGHTIEERTIHSWKCNDLEWESLSLPGTLHREA